MVQHGEVKMSAADNKQLFSAMAGQEADRPGLLERGKDSPLDNSGGGTRGCSTQQESSILPQATPSLHRAPTSRQGMLKSCSRVLPCHPLDQDKGLQWG